MAVQARATSSRTYTDTRARDALRNPLGAYFRVNHKDLVAMHAAFAEVGVLYASARARGLDQAAAERQDRLERNSR